MAIDAGGSIAVAALHGLAMEAAIVGSLLVGVARRTADFKRWRFVSGALYVGVAVHAGEHAAVNRIFERLGIDVQADRLAVDVMGKGAVAMTGEALVRGGFGMLFAGGVGGSNSYD